MTQEKPINEIIWENVLNLIRIRDINSEASLCEKAGINYSTYRSAKNRVALPSASSIVKIAKALGVSVPTLLSENPDYSRQSRSLVKSAVVDAIDSLDEDSPIFGIICKVLDIPC